MNWVPVLLSSGKTWFWAYSGELCICNFEVLCLLQASQGTNDLTLHELLASSPTSSAACILVYCVITPLLEEIVYRGYLLTSLSNNMKWEQAVLLSSAVFSASHFSGENFLQLLIIGSVLGCSCCWTGNLGSSFLIHSLYNSFILFLTYMSWYLMLVTYY